MDNREVVLDIQDLHARFHTQEGVVHAVNGISYEVHAGETVGIVGESGCGKSVSMLSVMDLLAKPPAEVVAEGILFKGKDLRNYTPAEMRKIRGSISGRPATPTTLSPIQQRAPTFQQPRRKSLRSLRIYEPIRKMIALGSLC